MKRFTSIAGGLLGLLALGVLLVALVLTLHGLPRDIEPASQVFQSPIITPTQPPYPPTRTPPSPSPATPTVVPTPIPRCAFTDRSTSDSSIIVSKSYQFSEPRVVLAHQSAIGIAEWLPDGQRLLITRLIPGQSREYIEIFDPRTGELQRYGERHSLPGKPVWLESHQAIAFADVGPDKQVVLRISRGERKSLEIPISGLASSFLDASPNGDQVVFFSKGAPDRPEILDLALEQRQTLPALQWVTQQDLSSLGQHYGPEPYHAVWSPSGNEIVFYNDTGVYLTNLASGKICEVDLDLKKSEREYSKRWALYMQWSPNGRYLGALTTAGDRPVPFVDLTLVDTYTGKLQALSPSLNAEYVYDFAWAPSSRQVIALVQDDISQGRPIQKLYLVDVQSGTSQPIAPHSDFGGGAIEGWQLAWSPDGQTLAVKCPVWIETEPSILEDRICTISVIRIP